MPEHAAAIGAVATWLEAELEGAELALVASRVHKGTASAAEVAGVVARLRAAGGRAG